jgi:hypothetical protein
MGGEKIFFMKGKEEFSPRTKFVLWQKLTGDHRIVGENLYAIDSSYRDQEDIVKKLIQTCEVAQDKRDTNL